MRITLTMLFLALSTFIFAQTNKDRQILIQSCIDLDEIQQYLQPIKIDGQEILVIRDNGMIPNNLELTKFGTSVKLMKITEIFTYGIETFIKFNRFNIFETEANIEFQIGVDGLTILTTFEKAGNNWILKTKKFI